ncbi:MAG TPA: hypothetical protein VGT82_07180, partial [Ktedonobacteraceae bacterium]|nr:hypothetical protein [Ktedonobacteraceae bacterium]
MPRASGEESSQQRFHALPSACQRWLERYGGWIVVAFIVSMAIYILALNALGHVPGRSFPLKLGSDLLQLAGEIIGLLFCLCSVTCLRIGWIRMYQEQKCRAEISSALAELSAQTLRARRRAWIAWVFLTLGIGLYACGQVVWTNYDIRMSSSQSPAPGFYNLCFAASYPAFLIGTLLLARRRRNIINQACLALDALAILVAGFALAWFFVLGPTIAALSGGFSAEVISLYFPSIDLFMVAVAILLMFSPLSLPSHRPVLRRLCLGLVLLVVVDSLLGYLSLTPSGFNTGTLQDILRPLSMMFISLAAIEYSRGVARE